MKKIVLVSCSSGKRKKQDCPCLACDMYQSPLFRKSRAYAERVGDGGWFILSAEHGLLPPDKKIEHYDKNLKDLAPDELIAWGKHVFQDLRARFSPAEHGFIILAGKKYCEFLNPRLKEAGFEIYLPLEGLGIGKRMSRLDALNNQKRDGLDNA